TVREEPSGRRLTVPLSDVRITSFYSSGESHYPASITITSYDSDYVVKGPKTLPEVKETLVTSVLTARVEAVKINAGIADSAFELTFPSGTTYVDTRDRETYVVDEAGTAAKLARDMNRPRLPVSEYTKEEAFRELRKARELEAARALAGRSGWRVAIIAVNIGILGGLVGYFVCRARARKSPKT
ncbi:MAG: hypothetical protein NUV77_18710, partial [Thermoguttaceae bacterium]|nr:hypothetical protein [Thermoguttaceae bacterium]